MFRGFYKAFFYLKLFGFECDGCKMVQITYSKALVMLTLQIYIKYLKAIDKISKG